MNYPARRISLIEGRALLWSMFEPGDYMGPVRGYTGDKEAVFFLLPCARDEGISPNLRSLHHVVSPPHVFRECSDGSLEIRASIGVPEWHCWLNEGNVWQHP